MPTWDPNSRSWSATKFELQFPLGVVHQHLTKLPSDFCRVGNDEDFNVAYTMHSGLGQQRIAYHVARSSLRVSATSLSCPWRPITFEELARSFPAQSLLQLYFQEQQPSAVIGQQEEFTAYLKELRFVGRIWHPNPSISPYWGTVATAQQVRFDATCRLREGHSEVCKRHSCVCGLSRDDALVAVRKTAYCWPKGVGVKCLCTPSKTEVINMLHASLSVCALSEPKVLHWSTALGMQPCIRERQRDLL